MHRPFTLRAVDGDDEAMAQCTIVKSLSNKDGRWLTLRGKRSLGEIR